MIKELKCSVCGHHKNLRYSNLFDDRYGYEGTFHLYICDNCNHSNLENAPDSSELGHLYTEYYPRKSFNPDNFRPFSKGNLISNWLTGGEAFACQAVSPKKRVLDVGCGYGETLAYMEALGCDVYGIDADENVNVVADMYGFKIQVGTIETSTYQHDFFDYVTMNQVIEHIPDLDKGFSIINSILKPEGLLVMSTPNASGWGAKLFGKKWINWHTPYHQQFLSKQSLVLLAKKHGFDVESIKTITHSHWVLYQILHLLNYPKKGVASSFWAPYKTKRSYSHMVLQKVIVASKFLLIPHLITRFFDLLDVGDNYLIILKKKDVNDGNE